MHDYISRTFDDSDLGFVSNSLYKKLNPLRIDFVVNSIFVKYISLSVRGKSYSCSQSGRRASQFVAMAEWDVTLYGPSPTEIPESAHPDSKFRPVKVHYYLKMSASVERESVSHQLLAVVSWHLPYPNKNAIGKPAQVWYNNRFECGGTCTFLPIWSY